MFWVKYFFCNFLNTVRAVKSRQKKGLNRTVETTFLSERDAAVESVLKKKSIFLFFKCPGEVALSKKKFRILLTVRPYDTKKKTYYKSYFHITSRIIHPKHPITKQYTFKAET